jgi:hypothetical protein
MLPAIRRNPTGVFMNAARRFGDVVYFKIGPRRGYLMTTPSDIRHVLQDQRPQLPQESGSTTSTELCSATAA